VPDLLPFRETLGEAALRYPQADVQALAAAMLRLEREPGLRARLAAAADAAVTCFSWKEAARRTGEVLREATA
jgi:glycosyltransferase involved in cell wall biosynthesis